MKLPHLPESTCCVTYSNREDWLRGRLSAIGASEVSVMLGLAPATWGSRRSLFEKKAHQLDLADDREFLMWGSLLEPAIAQGFATLTGTTLANLGAYTRVSQPDAPFLTATLDYVIPAGQRGGRDGAGTLQIKNAGSYKSEEFAEGLPRHYQVQAQAEFAASGLSWGEFAVLFGGNELKVFPVERDDAFIALMLEEVREFVAMIAAGTPPPMDGSDGTRRALLARWPQSDEAAVALDESFASAWESHKLVSAELKRLEREKKEIENRFLEALGTASVGVIPGVGRMSFPTIHVAERVQHVKATSYRRIYLPTKADAKKASALLQEIGS